MKGKQVSGPCQKCGTFRRSLHREHVVPRWEFKAGIAVGDPEAPSNIQRICANCHEDKTYDETQTVEYKEYGRKSAAKVLKERQRENGRKGGGFPAYATYTEEQKAEHVRRGREAAQKYHGTPTDSFDLEHLPAPISSGN